MRRRILVLVVASTAFALLLLGVILVSVIWAKNAEAAQARAGATASIAAATVLDSQGLSTPRSLPALAQENEARIVVTRADGFQAAAGDEVAGAAWSATVTIDDVTATVSIPQRTKVVAVAGQAGLVLLLSLLVLGITALVAAYYTRRIVRPFDDFRDFISSLATGDRRGLEKRYGVAEIDMVADVLQASITRFDDTIERERRATEDASHQLKSPLTVISMRLEEIAGTDDVEVAHEEAARALAQVERLSGVVDEVVGVMREQRSSMPKHFAVTELVDGQVAEWLPAYRAEGRSLHVAGRTDSVVNAEPGAQAQALATLLENALRHGGGDTTVRLRSITGWAVIEVADQGDGVPPELEASVFDRRVSGGASSGLGLALARTLLAADGGRLELVSPRPAVFAMFLPRADRGATQPTAGADDAEPQADVRIAASSAAGSSSGNTQRR